MEGKANISAQIPVSLRLAIAPIVERGDITLAEYIRKCLSNLVAMDGRIFNPRDYTQLTEFIEEELRAGGPEAEALRQRLAELAASTI